MKTIDLKDWDEFQNKLYFPSDVEKVMETLITRRSSEIYFRGQANADWELKTTLQRLEEKIVNNYDFFPYLCKAVSICGAVDSYAGSNWNLDKGGLSTGEISFDTFEKLRGTNVLKNSYKIRKKIIEYLIYLRHCGFPSPLLDWSESPYVAAFFAFSEIPKVTERVAIYQFQEMPQGIKHIEDDPGAKIHTISYDFRTHKRHYLQQTRYTICVKQFGITQGFGKYEDAVSASEKLKCYNGGKHRQDSLIKYTIPSSERNKVLRHLYKMNITHVSLFETEEALIKTLALREMELWKD